MVKRGSHCVYDTKYHLVWAPKYRKWVLQGEIRKRVEELFKEIAEHHGFEIEEMVVETLKTISSKEIREEFPRVKKELWGGEFWEDGYFARTVGDKITAEVIKRYIKYHKDNKAGEDRMDFFTVPLPITLPLFLSLSAPFSIFCHFFFQN